jgi:hypothetical protein
MAFGGVTAILLIAAILVFGPFLVIWALNTLFITLAIPYSFESWCASVVLTFFMRMQVTTKG